MTDDDALSSRFDKIDVAIARDIERRRRNRRMYWALLIATALVAAFVVWQGRTPAEQVAAAVSADETLRRELALSVVEEPALVESVVASQPLQRAVAEQSGAAARVAAQGFASTPEFREIVLESSEARFDALAQRIDDLAARVEGVAERPPAPAGGGGEFAGRIDELERAQRALESEVAQSRASEAALRAEIDALREQLADADAAVVAMTAAAAQPRLARSYVLAENTRNALADVGLAVTLGRISNGRLSSVQFSDERGALPDSSAASLQIGDTLRITDRDGRRFAATFSWARPRFIARDYVGLELLALPPD